MKGVYVLLISIAKRISVSVGSLGYETFQQGFYVYVGSAQNNLEKRVKRHLEMVKPKFWHIDHLLSRREAKIVNVFYKEAGRSAECRIAEKLAKVATPVRSFGSSDCSCVGHLFRVEAYDYLSKFIREVGLKPLRMVMSMTKTGWCVWITGLPGSGKSTVSVALLELLKKKGVRAQLLSSDALRKVLTPKPSYSLEERGVVYATLVYIAELLTRNGVNVVIDATGNLRRYREKARKRIPTFIEAYLECPLDVCMKREAARVITYHAPTQIYRKAEKGRASTVPGVGQPYEPPSNPEITLDTMKCSPVECARKVLKTVLHAKASGKGES